MEKRLSPFAEEVSSLELAESPWFAAQLLLMASLRTKWQAVPQICVIGSKGNPVLPPLKVQRKYFRGN